MGNAESQAPKHRKRPSVHSGALYIPPPPVAGYHSPFTSVDFDKSNLELKENLPENLKVYCNAIEIMYRFWCSCIETLPQEQYKQTAILFYCNLFNRLPATKRLFGTKSMELQANKLCPLNLFCLFGMWRWLLTNLKDPLSGDRLIRRIKQLGVLHEKMNIKSEWYTLFLDAFHDTMADTVKEKYSARIRFCVTQIFTVVKNIMLNQEFDSLSSPSIAKLLRSLSNVEDCLNDPEASQYLRRFCEEKFCSELVLFYQDCRKFKLVTFEIQREMMGAQICKTYIGDDAECEINVSCSAKEAIYEYLQQHENVFHQGIFDECMEECVQLLTTNVWPAFRRSILRMAVDADIYYDQQQRTRARSNLEPPRLRLKLEPYSVSVSSGTPDTNDSTTPSSPPSMCTSQSSNL